MLQQRMTAQQLSGLQCFVHSSVSWLQVASVMGLMSVALDLLLLIHPMSNAQDEVKEVSSSRQDLKNDMQDLEAAAFLKPCKETPDSWDFAQVPLSPSPPLPSPPLPSSLPSLAFALPGLAFPSLPLRFP